MSNGTGKSLAMLPFFVRDYVTATRHLTLAERGAYTDLLFFQWENGHLPSEPERLARLIGCTPQEFASVWEHISEKFTESDEGLFNRRLEDHRAEALRLRTARVKSADETNAKRNAHRHGDRSADRPNQGTLSVTVTDTLTDTVTGTSPSPSPSPSPNPSPSKKDTPVPRSFHDQVIAAYHELCPLLPQVKIWSDERRKSLDARIRERVRDGKPADTIEYWRSFFQRIAASDFLSGRSEDPLKGACLEWFLKPKNFPKVIEGNYDNRKSNGARPHG
jgi:uncharacterized protein YdaU (DUF1376 family)